jgi:DNA-binding XRE family transcriptional regulator
MKIADWMSLKDLTDAEMAALLGVDASTVNRVRRGETQPSWPLAAKIKNVTEGAVSADDFLPALSQISG